MYLPYAILKENLPNKENEYPIEILDIGDKAVLRVFSDRELEYLNKYFEERRSIIYSRSIVIGYKYFVAFTRLSNDPINASDTLAFRHKIISDFISRFINRGRVLDVGCGIGHVSFELVRRGFKVSGIDIDKKAYDFAQQYAKLLSYSTDFKFGDFLLLDEWQEYDAIIFPLSCMTLISVNDLRCCTTA